MKSKVYFTKDISSDSLIKIYKALGQNLSGKVAVKISSGEPGGHNFLDFNLIKPLVNSVNGTIVECCTAYRGKRYSPKSHWEVLKEHGFMDIAPCDIMDEEGEIKLPIAGENHLSGVNYVGSHLKNYDSLMILSHFKGHAMGGFGGALKNMSIGIASRNGKAWIHSVGKTTGTTKMWLFTGDQDGFLESMAEACKSVIDFFTPKNIVYINVANNLSIDCDCDSNPKEPEMKDIGIFASLDPIALDQCCYDQIINSKDEGKASLVNRINKKHAIHIVEWGEKIGLGNREYQLINLDEGNN